MSDMKSIERCAGAYPIVFEFAYTDRVQHRTYEPGGDSNFSHWEESVPFTAHIVASNVALAGTAFAMLYPSEHVVITGVKPLLVINGFASVTRSYGQVQ